MIKTNCIICGKEIKVSPSQIKSKKTCSRKCDAMARKGLMSGDKNPAYKGGKVLDTNGYIRIRGSRNRKGCYEHQKVMEQYLGRKLQKGEEVHHINGIKTDNRIENLFLVDKVNHSRKHFELFIEVQRLEWENKWLTDELIKYKEKYGEL